jgi:hypothetical protein
MRILVAALLVGALTLATACGGGGAPAPAPTPVQAAPPAKPAGTKFTIDYFSAGFPPVQIEVIRAGTGNKVAGIGADVVMHYVANAQGKEPYASSRQAGSSPMETTVGVGKPGLVPGWDAAATHMRAGDLWKLTIPPELAYGPNGGPKVPPNSILEVEVEMVEVK